MKNILSVLCMILIISACKTKKVITPTAEKKKVVSPNVQKPDIPDATTGKMGKNERMRRPKIDPEQIVAQLGLSESQEKSFLDFWERNQAAMDKLRNESNGDRTAMRSQLRAVRESGRKELEEILTPEQFSEYKKILAKDRMKSRRGQ